MAWTPITWRRTIDVMARFSARGTTGRRAPHRRLVLDHCHGVVVLAFAFFVASLAHAWQVPGWLEPVGAGVSIALLLALGGLQPRRGGPGGGAGRGGAIRRLAQRVVLVAC